MFIIDMSFHSTIVEYFKKLKISLVAVKSIKELDEKDLPEILATHYYEKDIVFEVEGEIDDTGTIELKQEYVFIFDEEKRQNKADIYIKKCPSIIFLWKTVTPNSDTYYTYKKVMKIKDDVLVLKKNL